MVRLHTTVTVQQDEQRRDRPVGDRRSGEINRYRADTGQWWATAHGSRAASHVTTSHTRYDARLHLLNSAQVNKQASGLCHNSAFFLSSCTMCEIELAIYDVIV